MSIFTAAYLKVIILSLLVSTSTNEPRHSFPLTALNVAYVLAKVQNSSQHQHFPVNLHQLYCFSEVETMRLTLGHGSMCVRVFPRSGYGSWIRATPHSTLHNTFPTPTSNCRQSPASWLGLVVGGQEKGKVSSLRDAGIPRLASLARGLSSQD